MNKAIRTKDSVNIVPSKEVLPDSLQNPTDPDATYRKKGSEDNTGYVANIVETFDDENAIITLYDLQKNTYSDQQFSKNTIAKLGKQEEKMTAIADGAYYSEEISKKAAENNIEMIPTGLVGRTQKNNLDYTGFAIDEEKHEVLNCCEHCVPLESRYNPDKGKYTAKFSKDTCSDCSHRANCPVKEQKKCYALNLSENKYHREKLIERMGTKPIAALGACSFLAI